jgi:hypothetical protein
VFLLEALVLAGALRAPEARALAVRWRAPEQVAAVPGLVA